MSLNGHGIQELKRYLIIAIKLIVDVISILTLWYLLLSSSFVAPDTKESTGGVLL